MNKEKLISFKTKGLFYNEQYIDFKTATTNLSIFGGTGTGKTTSICYPILYKMLINNFSGLILDIKGDYTNIIRNFKLNKKYKDNFLILGVNDYCDEINIINGISAEKLRMFFSDIISGFNAEGKNSYWGMNGIEDSILIYEILRSKDISPTLADIYYYLVKNDKLEYLCKNLEFKIREKIKDRVFTDYFSIFNFDIKFDSGVNEQRTWQLSKILNCLKPFYENDYLRKYFCGKSNLDYFHIIYIKNKILTIELPMSEYNQSSIFALKMIKSIYIDTIREAGVDYLKSIGYGEDKFTFLLIDEYQQFINRCSSPSMDDNNWFDTSRGYGHINIISSQSIDSLIAKSSYEYTQQLIGNTRNIIHLSTNATESLNHIQILSNSEVKKNILSQNEDIAYFYIGKRAKNRLGYSGYIFIGKSKLKYMNLFINKPIPYLESKKIELEYIAEYEEPFVNNFNINDYIYENSNKNIWDYGKNNNKKINKNLKIITSYGYSEGFKDFNYICNKLGLYFSSISVYSVIYKNKLEIDFYSSEDAKDVFSDNSLILYIRGGGNMNDCFLNEEDHINNIEKSVSNIDNIIIGIGYGHVGDKFKLVENGTIKIYSITPTELAYDLNRLY